MSEGPHLFSLEYFERVRERTRRAVLCIPPEHIEWTWKAGKFTLGDQVRHIAAMERWMFTENALQRPSTYPGHGRELAEGFDQIVAYLDRMHAESVALLGTLGPEALERRTMTPGGASIPVWKWLRSMLEHEIHHRAWIHAGLAMLDVPVPPLYGLTEEQVRERSVPGEKTT